MTRQLFLDPDANTDLDEDDVEPKKRKLTRAEQWALRLEEARLEIELLADATDLAEREAIEWVERETERERALAIEERAEVCRLLVLARARLAYGWLVHHPARTSWGELVSPDHPDAVAWSLVGAIGLGKLRPMGEDCASLVMAAEERAFRLLDGLLQEEENARRGLKASRPALRSWSERDERRKADVVGLVERGMVVSCCLW